jgi:hypothetical protein
MQNITEIINSSTPLQKCQLLMNNYQYSNYDYSAEGMKVLTAEEYSQVVNSLGEEGKKTLTSISEKVGNIDRAFLLLRWQVANLQTCYTGLKHSEQMRFAAYENENLLNLFLMKARQHKEEAEALQIIQMKQSYQNYAYIMEKGDKLLHTDTKKLQMQIDSYKGTAIRWLSLIKAVLYCYDKYIAKNKSCSFFLELPIADLRKTAFSDWALYTISSPVVYNKIKAHSPEVAKRLEQFVIYPDAEEIKPDADYLVYMKQILNYE